MKAFVAAALLAVCSTACQQAVGKDNVVKGSKNYVTKQIEVSNFVQLKVSGPGHVIYTQREGDPTVEVYAPDNIIELLDIHVEGDMLFVGIKKDVQVESAKLEFRVTSETLSNILLTGVGDLNLPNGLDTDVLSVTVGGAGSVAAKNVTCQSLNVLLCGTGNTDMKNVTCPNFTVKVSGVGNVDMKEVKAQSTLATLEGVGSLKLTGSTDEAVYAVEGVGSLNAINFEAKNVQAKTSGVGGIKCNATETLKAVSDGVGGIKYKGNPQVESSGKGISKY